MAKLPAERILISDDEPLFLSTTAQLLRTSHLTCWFPI